MLAFLFLVRKRDLNPDGITTASQVHSKYLRAQIRSIPEQRKSEHWSAVMACQP
jgi:hypothetical protein